MPSEAIEVVRMTKPEIIRILYKTRDESNPKTPFNIYGYTIKLIVKNKLSDIDARALFDLAATIVTDSAGTYKFTLTTAHTCLPAGTYPGQLRWWSGSSAVAPDDSIDISFIVTDSVKQYP
jgi:hypothetical protein